MPRIAASLVLAAILLQGCVTLAVSAVGLASSAGLEHMLGGTAHKTFSHSLPEMRLAALKTLKRMDIEVARDLRQDGGWKIRGKAGERFVDIEFEALTERATYMTVIVAEGDVFNPDKATSAEIITQTAETVLSDVRRRRTGR